MIQDLAHAGGSNICWGNKTIHKWMNERVRKCIGSLLRTKNEFISKYQRMWSSIELTYTFEEIWKAEPTSEETSSNMEALLEHGLWVRQCVQCCKWSCIYSPQWLLEVDVIPTSTVQMRHREVKQFTYGCLACTCHRVRLWTQAAGFSCTLGSTRGSHAPSSRPP